MKDIWNWVVTSSADPEKTSLALKGLLTFGSGYVLNAVTALCGFGLVCLGIDADWLVQVINFITQVALGALYIVGGGIALFGLGRKVKLGQWSAFGRPR
ncbi:MAG: hypothetical protein ACK4UO_12970 [Pseudolabrys sp.]